MPRSQKWLVQETSPTTRTAAHICAMAAAAGSVRAGGCMLAVRCSYGAHSIRG